uniref:Solute carrier organic anion transporter family member n=1 Tax=Naja naja TaxID=35670 RepID=A0A8C7DYW0_NAJNA
RGLMPKQCPPPSSVAKLNFDLVFFVLCHGFLQFSQLMTSGYMKSSISTIERRFGLSSQTSGMVASFHEVGNTMLIIFVSYFGSRVHRPRVIGCGAILVSVAGLVISLPHFVSPPYEYDQFSFGKDFLEISIEILSPPSHGCPKESNVILILLLFGQTLLGIGGVPIQPFEILFFFLFCPGIIFAATALGPAIAFILGSFMLRFYVDIDKVSSAEVLITNKDPRWVGAWWLGFIFAAKMPKEVRTHRTTSKAEEASSRRSEMSSKKKQDLFPVVLLRNLKNPIFVMVVLAMVNLSAMIAGLSTFLAKFLEQQFTLSASMANMILGAINIPGAMLGIILGGAIMKSSNFSLQQATILCIFSMAFCTLFDVPLLFLGCPTQMIAGLDYSGSLTPESPCNCSLSFFNPVCGQDLMEYISPCFAGCTKLNINPITKAINYTECNCILVNGAIGYAKPGHCRSSCGHFLMPFILISQSIPNPVCIFLPSQIFLLRAFRSVKKQDKSFALGLQFLLLRLLAWLPAPMVYGSAIDTACLLWQYKCKKRASCRYYDHTRSCRCDVASSSQSCMHHTPPPGPLSWRVRDLKSGSTQTLVGPAQD